MGVFDCNRHGRSGIRCACPHVVAARSDGRPIDLIEVELFDLVWICRECEALFERALATGERDESVLNAHYALGRGWCYRCMEEWRERHALAVRRSDMDLCRPDLERPW